MYFYVVPLAPGRLVKIGVTANFETRMAQIGAHLFDLDRACTVRTRLPETARALEGLLRIAFARERYPNAPGTEAMSSGATEVYDAAAWPGMLKMVRAIVAGWPEHRLTLWRAKGLKTHPPGTVKPCKIVPFPVEEGCTRAAIRKRQSAGFLALGRAA